MQAAPKVHVRCDCRVLVVELPGKTFRADSRPSSFAEVTLGTLGTGCRRDDNITICRGKSDSWHFECQAVKIPLGSCNLQDYASAFPLRMYSTENPASEKCSFTKNAYTVNPMLSFLEKSVLGTGIEPSCRRLWGNPEPKPLTSGIPLKSWHQLKTRKLQADSST